MVDHGPEPQRFVNDGGGGFIEDIERPMIPDQVVIPQAELGDCECEDNYKWAFK